VFILITPAMSKNLHKIHPINIDLSIIARGAWLVEFAH